MPLIVSLVDIRLNLGVFAVYYFRHQFNLRFLAIRIQRMAAYGGFHGNARQYRARHNRIGHVNQVETVVQ